MKPFLLTLMLATHGTLVHAAGTITFPNSVLTRVQWYQGGSSINVPTTPGLVVYGVFWGTNAEVPNLALPLGSNSTASAGLISAMTWYRIPGTEAGQTVYMQIRGWSAAYGTNWPAAIGSGIFGHTDIRQVTLGTDAGPGTIIWQSLSGIDPHRFFPLTIGGLAVQPPAIVEFLRDIPTPLSTVVDEGNQGVVNASIVVTRRSTTPPPSDSLNFTTTVILSTTNMTALAGEDYVPTNIAVTFGPGEIAQSVRIKVTGDALPESDEQFGVKLSAASFTFVIPEVFVVTIREAKVASVRIEANHAVVSFATTRQRYALESSPDMISWSVVSGADNIAGFGGTVQVIDPAEACCGPRFYRTRILP